MQICLRGIRLRDRLSCLRIGVTDLRHGGLPLLVVYGGRNKHYAVLWLVEGEVGERNFVELMLLGDQRHRRVHPRRDYQVYEQAQNQKYHFEEPQSHQYKFDAYQQHQFEDQHEQPHIEQEQPYIEESQQHDGGGRFQGVPRAVYEAKPDGYAGGPSELTLLPHFDGHVACRIWVDADVSIF